MYVTWLILDIASASFRNNIKFLIPAVISGDKKNTARGTKLCT